MKLKNIKDQIIDKMFFFRHSLYEKTMETVRFSQISDVDLQLFVTVQTAHRESTWQELFYNLPIKNNVVNQISDNLKTVLFIKKYQNEKH